MRRSLPLAVSAAIASLAALFSAVAPAAQPGVAPTSEAAPIATAFDGERIFRQRCGTCHSVEPGKTSPLGPNLHGVVGRKAASADFKFTSALSAADLTWTPDVLDTYLAAPMKMVPGTRMVVSLPDAGERAAVIDWLDSTDDSE